MMLGEISDSQVSEKSIAAHLKDPTQTQTVKLNQPVPVELRYETIVLEDGKLHIFKDVYDQGTNTEDNLRAVLEANGSRLEDLTEEDRSQILAALNAMSAHPKAMPSPSTSDTKDTQTQKRKVNEKKGGKNQKEVVVELKVSCWSWVPGAGKLRHGYGKSTLLRRSPKRPSSGY